MCFAKGTKIATNFGDKNIEDIKIGDKVITPFGCKKVLACGVTGIKKTITKFGLTATENHKIFCSNKGFASIADLCLNDSLNHLTIKELLKWRFLKLLYLMDGNILLGQRKDIILLQKESMGNTLIHLYTEKFGSFITKKKYLKAIIFIIKTVIVLITTIKTLSVYHVSNIIKFLKTSILKSKISILNQLDHWLRRGIKAKKEENGISNMSKIKSLIENLELENVIFAVKNMNICLHRQQPVLFHANKRLDIMTIKDIQKENVLCVEKSFTRNLDQQQKLVKTEVVSQSMDGIKETVFNLTVENDGVYYANGILVSNCDSLAMLEQLDVSLNYGVIADKERNRVNMARMAIR
jgi:hypothetical protein